MDKVNTLSKAILYNNKNKKLANTTTLILLIALLAFSMVFGLFINLTLNKALKIMESRLGADLFVVPYSATTKQEFEDAILQGSAGEFYMSKALLSEIEAVDGIKNSSTQLYVTSLKLQGYTFEPQIIGIEKQFDFVVGPWLNDFSLKNLGEKETVVGESLNKSVGETLDIAGCELKVVGVLENTDTTMDQGIYVDTATAELLALEYLRKGDYSQQVSGTLINVEKGYTVDQVLHDINIHVSGVVAMRTNEMIADTGVKLTGLATIAKVITLLLWVLLSFITAIAFVMILNERKKDFAIYRVIGASKNKVLELAIDDNSKTSIVGSVIGALIGLGVSLIAVNGLSSLLNLPLMQFGVVHCLLFVLIAIIFLMIMTLVSTSIFIKKICEVDPAILLKGEK